MGMTKGLLVVALALMSGSAFAGLSDVVSLGKGRYMIGGTSVTVFGNASKMQAKAMVTANQHCAKVKPGSEAVVQDMQGESGKTGYAAYASGAGFGGGGQRATAQLVFTCEAPEAEPMAAPAESGDSQ